MGFTENWHGNSFPYIISSFLEIDYYESLTSRQRQDFLLVHKLVWRNLNPGYNVELTIKDGIQDICLLEGLLSEEQRLRINLVDLDTHKEDKLVFALTKNGKISISKYIVATRMGSPGVTESQYV